MTMTIAILSPGDMGSGVGQALIAEGKKAITALHGRSDNTRALAAAAGLEDAGSLIEAVARADLILSIVPPDRAVDQARAVSDAMTRTAARPAYVDCNAISPMTASIVQAAMPEDAVFIDCGIIGLNPIKTPPTRFYVSGTDCSAIKAIDSETISVRCISDEIGKASALKMVYAAMTKGTWTLQVALLMTAMKMGVLDDLVAEFAYSQSGPLQAMKGRVPALPADAARWVPEMKEIAATFEQAGVTPDFHNGAAEVFRVLSQTPFASETRATLDTSRTLEETLVEAVKHL